MWPSPRRCERRLKDKGSLWFPRRSFTPCTQDGWRTGRSQRAATSQSGRLRRRSSILMGSSPDSEDFTVTPMWCPRRFCPRVGRKGYGARGRLRARDARTGGADGFQDGGELPGSVVKFTRTAISLLAGGLVLMVVGGLLVTACESPSWAACNPTGFGLWFVGLGLVPAGGFIFFVGMLALSPVTDRYPWVVQGFRAYCPVCGRPLGWSDVTGRWYCLSCREYR